MKNFWKTVWDIIKVIGFLLLVAVGGWALWKYWLKSLFTSEGTSDIEVDVTNPDKDSDRKKADTIEERLNRLMRSSPND